MSGIETDPSVCTVGMRDTSSFPKTFTSMTSPGPTS